MTKILIADDHHFLRSGVAALLTDAGHEVVASVDSGEAALAAIAECDPEVVILDVRMPGIGGVAALERMRKAGDRRPVVILAAEIDDDDLLAISSAGANAVLFKHCAPELLVDAVSAAESGQTYFRPEVIGRLAEIAARPRKVSALERLNPKERLIAQRVARGERNREIGEALGITEGTVKSYLHGIYAKLGIENRTGLALLVLPDLAGEGR